MQFGLADVEKALASLHGVSPEKRSNFAGRLKHLQRMGFPPGTNTGRGRPAHYRAEHLFLLAVVLELNQFGFNPERAVRLTTDSLQRIAEGVHLALNAPANQIFCNISPEGLADLTNESETVTRVMSCRDAGGYLAAIDKNKENLGRIAFFSVTNLIRALADFAEQSRDDFSAELGKWALGLKGDGFPSARQTGA